MAASSTVPSRICAACRVRARLATTTRAPPARRFPPSPARPFSTSLAARPSTRLPATSGPVSMQYHPTPASSRRALSSPSSSSSSSITTTTTTTQEPTPSSPTPPPAADHPPMPAFYALFPQTLPLGPPPRGSFRLDARALRREFLRLQASAHPDLNRTSASSQAAAEAASARINEAYRTLSSPLLRAQYLLRECHGVDLAGDEAGATGVVDADVLGTVLEVRERIEDAEREEELEELRRENEERVEREEEVLERMFAEGDVEGVKGAAVRLRYWVNVRESLDGWEKGKGAGVLQH